MTPGPLINREEFAEYLSGVPVDVREETLRLLMAYGCSRVSAMDDLGHAAIIWAIPGGHLECEVTPSMCEWFQHRGSSPTWMEECAYGLPAPDHARQVIASLSVGTEVTQTT